MMLLSLLLLPLLGAVLIGVWPGLARQCAGRLAITWAVLPLVVLAALQFQPAAGVPGVLAEWSLPWMPDANIQLAFSVDGTSLVFLLLTSLVTLFALAVFDRERGRGGEREDRGG